MIRWIRFSYFVWISCCTRLIFCECEVGRRADTVEAEAVSWLASVLNASEWAADAFKVLLDEYPVEEIREYIYCWTIIFGVRLSPLALLEFFPFNSTVCSSKSSSVPGWKETKWPFGRSFVSPFKLHFCKRAFYQNRYIYQKRSLSIIPIRLPWIGHKNPESLYCLLRKETAYITYFQLTVW